MGNICQKKIKNRSRSWSDINNPIHGKTGKNAHHITPVYKIDKETHMIICFYDTIRQAELDTNVFHSNIVKCCLGQRKTAGGYIWKYKKDVEESVNNSDSLFLLKERM